MNSAARSGGVRNYVGAPPLVVVESPLAGEFELNQRYARWCCRDAMIRCGELPIASHLLYTQFLNYEDPEERKAGIDAGLAWAEAAQAEHVYYLDLCPAIAPEALFGTDLCDRDINIGGVYIRFSRGMASAWHASPGDVRTLSTSNPEYWERFLAGEEPPHTRGSVSDRVVAEFACENPCGDCGGCNDAREFHEGGGS